MRAQGFRLEGLALEGLEYRFEWGFRDLGISAYIVHTLPATCQDVEARAHNSIWGGFQQPVPRVQGP